MDLKLKDRKAVITGTSKGIGRAIAEMLTDDGCHVALCGRDEVHVNAAVGALRKKNAIGSAILARQNNATAAADALQQVQDLLGKYLK